MPYPADYGGVIDVFYRLSALKKLGVDVVLHAFTYGRQPADELEQLCREVHYYQRDMNILHGLSRRPFIVASRDNRQLLENLMRDDAPILLEGLHCCAMLEHLPTSRSVLVRAHNVEHDYYNLLADAESNTLKRVYFRSEARKLRRYEKILLKASSVLAVTEADAEHFRSIGCHDVRLMPSSHFDDTVVGTPSPEDYAERGYVLYHGDLSVPENIKAIQFLSREVFARSRWRFVVAGRNPSPELSASLGTLPNVKVVAGPDAATMQGLIAGAHVQIMVTDMPTGLKLKLLNSLYAGRHCLVNNAMIAGTPLADVCTVADTGDELLAALEHLMRKPFTADDVALRRRLLGDLYSNEANARTLLSAIKGS